MCFRSLCHQMINITHMEIWLLAGQSAHWWSDIVPSFFGPDGKIIIPGQGQNNMFWSKASGNYAVEGDRVRQGWHCQGKRGFLATLGDKAAVE